jgi:hypothetical protein
MYQSELFPILIDSYEVHKLATRHLVNEVKFMEDIELILKGLYVQLNPDVIERVILINFGFLLEFSSNIIFIHVRIHFKFDTITNDEVLKYCMLADKKDKMNKQVKTKAKN